METITKRETGRQIGRGTKRGRVIELEREKTEENYIQKNKLIHSQTDIQKRSRRRTSTKAERKG